jgi:hypothetical protein
LDEQHRSCGTYSKVRKFFHVHVAKTKEQLLSKSLKGRFLQKFFTTMILNLFEKYVQRFLRSVSGNGTGRHRELPVPAPASAPTGTDRPGPAPIGLDRHRSAWTGTDRPGLFYDVFDKNFLNIMLF